MAVRFQCNSCQVVKAVNMRLLGREINCPQCGEPVQLPTQAQVDRAKAQREEAKRFEKLEAGLKAAAIRAEAPAKPSGGDAQAAKERALAAASASFARPKPTSGEDMDMTPMVDVTFLLLIFFMVTASFSVQKTIQRPPPRDQDASTTTVEPDPDEPADIVTVQVDEFNAFNVVTSDWDRVVGSKQDLILALNEAHQGDSSGNQPTKVIVQAHEDCIHAAVVAALDAGREADFESFEVSTVQQFE